GAGHAHQPRDRRQWGEGRGIARVRRVTIARQERVELSRAGRGGDLHQVARLLLGGIGAQRALDEASLRHRREQAAESLVRGRRCRKQEAKGRPELHATSLRTVRRCQAYPWDGRRIGRVYRSSSWCRSCCGTKPGRSVSSKANTNHAFGLSRPPNTALWCLSSARYSVCLPGPPMTTSGPNASPSILAGTLSLVIPCAPSTATTSRNNVFGTAWGARLASPVMPLTSVAP